MAGGCQLNSIGNNRGSTVLTKIDLGKTPITLVDRGSVDFGTFIYRIPSTETNTQLMSRIDHSLSETHRISMRYTHDYTSPIIDDVTFPGYMTKEEQRGQNFLFSDTWTFSSTWTNEFRFSYGRLGREWFINPDSDKSVFTQPLLSISTVDAPGLATNKPQFRYANNWSFQETQSKIVGRHTFRYGVDLLKQLARQRPPFNERGSFSYRNNTKLGYSAFANYLEDFSGPSGSVAKVFGEPVYYPSFLRHSYFFQDTWKMTTGFTLTLGLRYENFGQPANNAFKYPAFGGFGTLEEMLTPNKVDLDNNNFAPTLGIAWTPAFKSGVLKKFFGDGKSVWRAGYQISYDTWFNNLLSNISSSTPNTNSTSLIASSSTSSRGISRLSGKMPVVAGPISLKNDLSDLFEKHIRNPYTQRYSLGLQRELPNNILLDVSYIGTGARKLFISSDLNPGTSSNRLYNDYGIRRVRSSQGNSNYHSLQIMVDRKFKKGYDLLAAYTFSKNIDSGSEVFDTTSSLTAFSSIPIFQGGSALDRGLADIHRKHRFTLSYSWQLPGFKTGLLSYPFGGWKITGITALQSGMPYTIANGVDRNGDGLSNDRPDIANTDAPINTRAYVVATKASSGIVCATGYYNPDAAKCVSPSDVRWIEGVGQPNASTVGRNTLFTNGVSNTDFNLSKTFRIREGKTLEYRLETFNIFNHPQFTSVPSSTVNGTLAASAGDPQRFLNMESYSSGGTRTMRMQLKFIF